VSVKYLVEEINEKAPGFGTAKILRKINECQNIIFSRPNPTTIHIVPTTGLPPLLTTTAGTFEYSIPDVSHVVNGTTYTLRINKVTRVYVAVETYYNQHEIPLMGDEFWQDDTRYESVEADSVPATETAKAKIIFKGDPDTTTDKYYIEGLIEPIQVTTTSIPLMIPRQFERAIFDYVVGEIQDQGYGEDSRLDRFYEYWLPKIYNDLTDGARSVTPNTPVRY